MSILINGIEMPKGADEHRLIIRANGQVIIDKKTYWEEAEAVPVQPHGRLIDADKIGLTDFEIILCQKGNPFKNALEMLLEKIENAPTVIQASGKDTDVPTREEGE